jgi:hypothetical protein
MSLPNPKDRGWGLECPSEEACTESVRLCLQEVDFLEPCHHPHSQGESWLCQEKPEASSLENCSGTTPVMGTRDPGIPMGPWQVTMSSELLVRMTQHHLVRFGDEVEVGPCLKTSKTNNS